MNDIWEDAWIPNGANRKVITQGDILSKVGDLIDPINNKSGEDLARQILWPIDAVLAIPLPVHEMSDFIAWHFI